ncbi:MAG: formylglycine-generating enzyme family protein [Gammaproteobacteria bacterium]
MLRQGVGRYRLPAEGEWEYAARAGSRGRYSFGDSEGMLCDYGNVADRTVRPRYNNWPVVPCDDGALYTAPVGGYRPNPFGLYDLHRNVWEWTEDCYHPSYAGAPSDEEAWTAVTVAGKPSIDVPPGTLQNILN